MTMNMNLIKGYAFEYAVAYYLEEKSSGDAHIAHTDQQIDLSATRREYYRYLQNNDKNSKEYHMFCEINSMAKNVACLLPVPYGNISFVETTNNTSEVYDIYYNDRSDELIKVSCKTREVSDKSYSFSSGLLHCDEILDIMDKYHDKSKLYIDLKHNKNFVADIIQAIYDYACFYPQDFAEFNSHIVIGNGGYYKTIPDGTVRYYPKNSGTSSLLQDSIYIDFVNNSLCYTIQVENDDGYIHIYNIRATLFIRGRSKSPILCKGNFMKKVGLDFTMSLNNSHTIF